MGIITSILTRPSQRTQMEATLTGLSVLMITSLATPIYMIFFTEASIWIKVFTSIGSVGIILFMFANLSLTYIQYRSYKEAMGMYEPSQKLLMKLEDAKIVRDELEALIKLNGGNKQC